MLAQLHANYQQIDYSHTINCAIYLACFFDFKQALDFC